MYMGKKHVGSMEEHPLQCLWLPQQKSHENMVNRVVASIPCVKHVRPVRSLGAAIDTNHEYRADYPIAASHSVSHHYTVTSFKLSNGYKGSFLWRRRAAEVSDRSVWSNIFTTRKSVLLIALMNL